MPSNSANQNDRTSLEALCCRMIGGLYVAQRAEMALNTSKLPSSAADIMMALTRTAAMAHANAVRAIGIHTLPDLFLEAGRLIYSVTDSPRPNRRPTDDEMTIENIFCAGRRAVSDYPALTGPNTELASDLSAAFNTGAAAFYALRSSNDNLGDKLSQVLDAENFRTVQPATMADVRKIYPSRKF